MEKSVIILGAGPAGLSAGLELSKHGYKPVILEMDNQVGGMSRTLEYKGYRFDMGPHRFFTKSNEINEFWYELLGEDLIDVPRLTRIYYQNKFFFYPVKLLNIIKVIGLWQSFLIGLSYLKQKLFPYKEESSFEDWVTNRFGKRLYSMFFRNYTQKLWGVDPKEISADWAAQRIKGLSISSAVKAALFANKGQVKTLIEKFKYPKHGAGQMYEAMAKRIQSAGGEVKLKEKVEKIIRLEDGTYRIVSSNAEYTASNLISSIPFTGLFHLLQPACPPEITEAADKLTYRSNIEVNLIIKKDLGFKDNWIYLHDPNVSALRLVNYRNWGEWMNPQKDKTPVGMEYFCDENDELWKEDDQKLVELALTDLNVLGFCSPDDYEDAFVIRNPKSYPVYFGEYQKNLDKLKQYFVNELDNIQVIGRYGMYKYNNMDHSIMTGLCAARNIIAGKNLHDIWEVNVDQEYHEEKKA